MAEQSSSKLDKAPELFQSAQEKVFSNSLICKQIFENLDLESIEQCRLVCRSWNEEASQVMSIYTYLNLNKAFKESTTIDTFTTIPTFSTTKLVRQVKTNFFSDEYPYPDYNNSNLDLEVRLTPPQQLLAFCMAKEQRDNIISIKVLNSDGNDLIRPLAKILKNFQNLNSLNLEFYGDWKENETFIVDLKDLLPDSLNLKSLFLSPMYYKYPSHLKRFINRILKASRNLTNLVIFGNYYPNLSSNLKLEELTIYNFNFVKDVEDDIDVLEDYNLRQLERMIKDVASSLEILELGNPIRSRVRILAATFEGSLTLPVLPKLKTFINNALWIYPMKSLNCFENCPQLDTIELAGKWTKNWNIDKLFSANSTFKLPTLKTLELGQFTHVRVIKAVNNFCPGLKSFKFHFGRKENVNNLTDADLRNQVVSVFTLLKKFANLEHLSVKFDWCCEIKSLDFFPGLKTLEIENGQLLARIYDLKFDLKGFKELLLKTKKMDHCKLINFHMEVFSAGRILRFVSIQELPVKFLNF